MRVLKNTLTASNFDRKKLPHRITSIPVETIYWTKYKTFGKYESVEHRPSLDQSHTGWWPTRDKMWNIQDYNHVPKNAHIQTNIKTGMRLNGETMLQRFDDITCASHNW